MLAATATNGTLAKVPCLCAGCLCVYVCVCVYMPLQLPHLSCLTALHSLTLWHMKPSQFTHACRWVLWVAVTQALALGLAMAAIG